MSPPRQCPTGCWPRQPARPHRRCHRLGGSAGAGAREVHELGLGAERALGERRPLAHGVYPPLLTDSGVPEALRWANAAAALSCRALDGRSAIPGRAELEAFLARAA